MTARAGFEFRLECRMICHERQPHLSCGSHLRLADGQLYNDAVQLRIYARNYNN